MLLSLFVLMLVGGGILFYQMNKHKVQNLTYWEKWNFPYLDAIHNPRAFEVPGYEFIKLSDQDLGMQNRVLLYPEEDWHSEEVSDEPHFWTQQSRVFYNKDKAIFGVGLQYAKQWIFFTANGEIVKELSEEDMPHGNYQSWVMVDNSQKYYRFDDQEADIYVAFFAKERYNWSRHNPLANIGSPTAGHGSYWWWFGNAYFKVQLEKAAFVFKTDGQMIGISSDTPYYKVMIDFYTIPKEYTNGKEVVLIYQAKSYENMNDGLFMIREKE